MKILVAEDDPVSRRLLEVALGEWGFEVVATGDGAEALEILREEKGPSLAVLDWMMPGVTGPEICQTIREGVRGSSVYVILLTSRESSDDVVRGLESGANDYITKPYDFRELRARVQVGRRVIGLQTELARRIAELQEALDRVNQLQGLLPICSYCKKSRDDKNYWHQVEVYLAKHSTAQFSHGFCPDCYEKVVKPEMQRFLERKNARRKGSWGMKFREWGPQLGGRPGRYRRGILLGIAGSCLWIGVVAGDGVAEQGFDSSLTGISELRAMTAEQAGGGRPVRVEGTVTFLHRPWHSLFLQDGTNAVFVFLPDATGPVKVGERVEVEGTSGAGEVFPIINNAQIRVLGEGEMPQPVNLDAGVDQLRFLDCHRAEFEGVVREVRRTPDCLDLKVVHSGVELLVRWFGYSRREFLDLVDGRVRVRGVLAFSSDNATHQLFAGGADDLEVVRVPPSAPFAGLQVGLVAAVILFSRTPRPTDERFLRLITIMLGQLEPLIQRKQAEAALRKSAELFRRLSDCSPLGILLTDAVGRFIYSNPRCRSILGVTAMEGKDQGWLERLHPEDREVIASQWEEAIKAQSELSCEFRVDLIEKAIWVHLRSAPVTADPRSGAGFVVTVEDITERKSLEAQFLQAQKMDTVGRLAGGVAHDFNNLLTAISSFGRLAKDSLPTESPAHGDVDMILKAAERAANLTRQLLAFARREVAVPQVLNLETVLTDLEKMLRRLIREDIELAVEPGAGVWPLRVDPSQLEQVLFNLVVNARDAMPHGGKLRIETENLEVRTRGESHLGPPVGDYVLLRVSDTGTGMTDEVQAHIFEPFFTTKTQGKGTGLGLATVYGIVRQNGGFIEVDSTPAVGTTFNIHLPRATEESRETRVDRAEIARTSTGTETVLVAEDEPEVPRLVERILKSAGYQVLLGANGDEALEVSRRQTETTIHLLLTDMVMPKMGGKQLADRLRHERPGIKVLFMSGYTEELLGATAGDGSEPTLIQKPFSPETLTQKIRELLDSDLH